MKKLVLMAVLLACSLVFGCSRAPATNAKSTHDVVSNDTKPPDLDSNAIASNNPRKNRKDRPDENPSATPAPAEFRAAPENSEVSVMMNTDGSITEIRIFKDHPQISKAEATWSDPASKTLKVYLKNGKVLTAKTDKIPNLNSVASDVILQAVGVKSSATRGDRPRVVSEK
ncbi:MAG: hypothetical protein ABL999_01920 [Pyrinomonadaceae bacterium]